MKITVFTSNQPRHIALINRLAGVCDELFAVQECNTIFPGQVADFYRKSPVMQQYFSGVMAAENKWFGDVSFAAGNVRSLPIKGGDLNGLGRDVLAPAMASEVYVVFGASYIKGWLIDHLVAHGAINIHMGLSPYYRGSSCNFWALYDGRPQCVGATIHKLSKGLDSGPMLWHCLPTLVGENAFEFTMKAVVAAQHSLVDRIASGQIGQYAEQTQDKSLEMRYTRNADFTDAVAGEFLSREWDAGAVGQQLVSGKYPTLLEPYWL